MKLLLQHGRVIDPSQSLDEIRTVALADGRFVAPASLEQDPAVERFDARGLAVLPGFIDLHVHFREPGQEYKEDLASGTRAAAAGGFTTVLPMPNTVPPIDCVAAVRDLEARFARTALIRCLPCACLSLGRQGQALADIRRLKAETGVVALTDDGSCIQDPALMRAAMALAAELGLPVVDHCEDVAAMTGGVVRREIAERLGVPGLPPETESNIVARDIELSRATGAHFHAQHLSCSRSVELVRAARAAGLRVSAEATPHHLCLTCEALPLALANAKMNPPLGTEADRQALLRAVADGTIQAIATDHAPHAPREKARGLAEAPFGIIGLETAFPLCYTELVGGGHMSLSALVERFTCGPARLLGLPYGTLAPGASADLALVDLDAVGPIDLNASFSKSRNSPFHGRQVRGRIAGTICAGRWVYRASGR